MRKAIVLLAVVCALGLSGCGGNSAERELAGFVEGHVGEVAPLWKAANLTYWEATTTGKAQAWEKLKELQLAMRAIYSDRAAFAQIKAFREGGAIDDPRLARQLEKLYFGYLGGQIEPELQAQIVELDTAVQETYNGYRATIEGESVTMSDIYTLMTTEGKYRIEVKEPLAIGGNGDTLERDVARCSEAIEEFIRLEPTQWVWMHKRWKSVSAEMYK